MEEAQHAKLDTLIVDALAEGRSERELAGVTNEFFQIASFLDNSMKIQARFNVEALERGLRRTIEQRDALIVQQYRAARWTYLISGLTHDRFKATLENISPNVAARIGAATAPRNVQQVASAA
jgi:hypothetical protein